VEQAGSTQTYYSQGFPVGEKIDNKYYVNNHVHLVVDYHAMIDEVSSGWVTSACPSQDVYAYFLTSSFSP